MYITEDHMQTALEKNMQIAIDKSIFSRQCDNNII